MQTHLHRFASRGQYEKEIKRIYPYTYDDVAARRHTFGMFSGARAQYDAYSASCGDLSYGRQFGVLVLRRLRKIFLG